MTLSMGRGAAAAPVDVAVVGGGISGLYVAWSLVAHAPPGAPPPRVAVLEASDRLGGRLQSVRPPGAPHLVAELGGRQFVPGAHALVGALVERFGLATHPWRHADDRHLYHLRGVRAAAADLEAGTVALPYDLRPSERSRTPQALFELAATAAVPELASMGAGDWPALLADHPVDGRSLHDWGIGELIGRSLSGEAVALIRDGGGIRELVSGGNAGAVLAMFAGLLSGETPLALDRGYQALALELADAAQAAGADIRLGACATRIDHDERGVHVRVRDAATVHARHVVLALPRRAIELLDHDGAPWDGATFARDLDSVEPLVHDKGFATYAKPWWSRGGTSFTDQPIRECIYNGTEREAAGGEPGNETSLLEVTYADAGFASFWATMARQDGAVPYGPAGPTPEHRASREMVALWQRQLAELHGLARLPEPTWACFRDWSEDPFGAAAHLWRRGIDGTRVMPRIRRPSDAPVYVCGEAFSATQGWVEGALQTAQHILEDHLGVPRPAWLAGVPIGP